jgi:CheY-like chemotaxis protein
MNLGEVIMKVNSMLTRIIGEHITVTTDIAPDLWTIRADPSQIEQVIMNLGVNARDAMPDGGRLIISAENVMVEDSPTNELLNLPTGPHILLSVRDSGVGMTEEVKEHLFEPFFTTKEVGKGTGLGLATVYGIVKQCEGAIYINSELGLGTVVRIYFPKSSIALEEKNEPEETADTTSTGHETILIVEDNSDVRNLAVEILVEKGYKILEAVDGFNALEIAELNPFDIDLLLTDIVMPGINGRDLAERLVQVRPNLKVLYMSGYNKLPRGADDSPDTRIALLPKPYTPRELTSKIRQVLDES